jgi:hypothetical protein
MKAEHLMEIALTLFPNGTRVQAARNLADAVNKTSNKEAQRSERTVEAYCQGQRKIPMEYSVVVLSYLQSYQPELYSEIEPKVSMDPGVVGKVVSPTVNFEEVLAKMEKNIDKLQAATQSTGMLLAIRAMCEDCAGGPAGEPGNTCWWKNCPLRAYSDMPLAEKAQSI